MKLSDMLIVFVIFLFIVFTPLLIKSSLSIDTTRMRDNIHEVLDDSCRDAVQLLIQPSDNGSIEIIGDGHRKNFKTMELSLEKSTERFYETLGIALGLHDNQEALNAIKCKIPIKIAVGYDGYYINAWQEDKHHIKEVWYPKREFLYKDTADNINVKLTLDDYVFLVNDDGTETRYKVDDLIGKYKDPLFSDKFKMYKMGIINNMITTDLRFYTSECNKVAESLGLGYTFTIPQFADRSIHDICFMAFMQENPTKGFEIMNTYGFGVARIVRHGYLYGNRMDGIKLYHTKDCPDAKNADTIFDNCYDGAVHGFKPHRKCIVH